MGALGLVGSTGFPIGLLVFFIVFGLFTYIFWAYCLMKQAQRLGADNTWFAFIPILYLWLMCDMGDRDSSWFIIMLITSFCCGIIALVMMILIMMDVAEKLGFENWWGLLLLVPIFNYYVMYKLAFTEPR